MTYTTHGHHIPGTIKGTDRPKDVIRCGGMVLCEKCQDEASKTPKDIPASSVESEKMVEWDIDANRPASESYPAEIIEAESDLEKELGRVLNGYENESGTPDFILAMYLKAQLDLFNQTIKNRAVWRGESVELPALLSLHQEQENAEQFAAYFQKLVEDGVIVVKENLEYTDLYRELLEYKPSKKDVQTVPLVTYQDGHRNEIGTADVTITPGEIAIEGRIVASAEAIFADPGEAYSVDLTEPKETPPPVSRFEKYQRGE
jgi:hypothetical protein